MSKWKSCDDVWAMYQLGQVSADHTDKQVFCEIYQQMIDRIAEPEAKHTALLDRLRTGCDSYEEINGRSLGIQYIRALLGVLGDEE